MSEVNILKDSILKIRIRGHTPLNPHIHVILGRRGLIDGLGRTDCAEFKVFLSTWR